MRSRRVVAFDLKRIFKSLFYYIVFCLFHNSEEEAKTVLEYEANFENTACLHNCRKIGLWYRYHIYNLKNGLLLNPFRSFTNMFVNFLNCSTKLLIIITFL